MLLTSFNQEFFQKGISASLGIYEGEDDRVPIEDNVGTYWDNFTNSPRSTAQIDHRPGQRLTVTGGKCFKSDVPLIYG